MKLPFDFDIFSPSTLEEAGVDPDARERLAGEALGLRDLALVVREDEVLAARVQVDRLAEVLLRHHRALDVPAGEAPRRALGERACHCMRWPGSFFQSAKSRGSRFASSVTTSRLAAAAPASRPSASRLPQSLP